MNEDVFAYSNRLGDERALVIYHNTFGDARGWISVGGVRAEDRPGRRESAGPAHAGRGPRPGERRRLVLDLPRSGQWAGVHPQQRQLLDQGLYVELGAYRRGLPRLPPGAGQRIGQYGQLTAYLDGRGVPSIEEALREIRLQPIQRPFAALVEPGSASPPAGWPASGPGRAWISIPSLFRRGRDRLRDFLSNAALDAADGDLEGDDRSASPHLGACSDCWLRLRSRQPSQKAPDGDGDIGPEGVCW